MATKPEGAACFFALLELPFAVEGFAFVAGKCSLPVASNPVLGQTRRNL